MCPCVCILSVAAVPQRPTAGPITILFNAGGFVWQGQPDLCSVSGAASGAGMLLSE